MTLAQKDKRSKEQDNAQDYMAAGGLVKESLQKIEGIQESLEGIRKISRAKVLAGLVQLKLNAIN